MAQCYIELRKSAARGTDSIAADLMRHLHTRQHLGKTVVICEQTVATLSAARKQWLKLSRVIQKQRASTLNADKILKYTHTITHMQHMLFSAKPPLEQPEADVYFLLPTQRDTLPAHCWSAYIVCPLSKSAAQSVVSQLPAGALIIDYEQSPVWHELGLPPKKMLEEQVAQEWRQVQRFLATYHIDETALNPDDLRSIDTMDDALDTLLGVSHRFLQVANEFQRALELARPLRLSKQLRQQYDSLVLLAHRVQALSPGAFTQHFLESYNEDDTFFLYDPRRRDFAGASELPAQAVLRHRRAGRYNLAKALQIVIQTTRRQ